MSLTNTIEKVNESIINNETRSAQQIIKQIKKFLRLKNQQKILNQITAISLPQVAQKLVSISKQALKKSGAAQRQQIAAYMKRLKQWVPNGTLSSNTLNDINQIIRTHQKRKYLRRNDGKIIMIEQPIKQQQQIIITQPLIQKQENVNRNKQESNIVNRNKQIMENVRQQNKNSGISEQLGSLAVVLNSRVPEMVGTKGLPQSINYLNKYAVVEGYQPIGSVSDKYGSAYIGRQIVTQGNQKLYISYPKTLIPSGQTPNIANNFRYYAGKAINAWNGFVDAEAKLVNYTKQISTQSGRKQYLFNQIDALNYATFAAQALATLCYYYVQIPLQLFVKYKYDKFDGTQNTFYQQYVVGDTVSKNPFLFPKQKGLAICKSLFLTSHTQPDALLLAITQYLLSAQYKNSINSQRITQFAQYRQRKQTQAMAFFGNLGIPQQKYNQTLNSKNIVGVKTKKFILPSMFTNTDILQIMEKVKDKNKKDKAITVWNLNWGAQTIMCHDYVWEYQL